MKRDDAHVEDVLRAAKRIREFASNTSRDKIGNDALTRSAILHQFLVMGEAAKRLSDGFTSAHADVPWSHIAKMRDRLIHGYDTVDIDILWTTIEQEIAPLITKLSDISRNRG